MTGRPYPVSIAELDTWRKLNRATMAEARSRLARYVALQCIASSPMAELLSFKGGNALRFAYHSPRSTIDLDFTASDRVQDDANQLAKLLANAFALSAVRFGVKLRLQSVRRRPSARPESTMPTYDCGVGYQLPGDRHYADLETLQSPLSQVVKLEISLNDVVCEVISTRLTDQIEDKLRICSREDIVAEKLRAILQQLPRNRRRPQDVYDIARIVRESGRQIDRRKISTFLMEKANAREIIPSKHSFDDEVKARSKIEYELLRDATGAEFIPFDDAWDLVIRLVRSLDIPE